MNSTNRFALLVGTLLLVEGVWGMFSPVVFGVLTTNYLHAAIHIVLGIIGISTAISRQPRGFLLFLGGLLLSVGIFWLAPSTRDIVTEALAVNRPVAVVNIAVAVLSFVFARQSATTVNKFPQQGSRY